MDFKWFERHQKGLLVVLTIFTVLTFSITGALYSIIQPEGAPDGPDTAGTYRSLTTGEEIEVSAEEFTNRLRQLHTIYSLLGSQSNVDNRQVWTNIVLLNEAMENGVWVSDEELTRQLQTMLNGVSQERYRQWLDSAHLSPRQFEEMMREQLILDRFIRLNSFVFIPDKEVYESYRGRYDDYELEYVTFPWEETEGVSADAVTDEQLTEFYDEMDLAKKSEFRREDEVAFEMAYLKYSEVDPDALQAKLPDGMPEPTEEELKANYERDRFRYRNDEEGGGFYFSETNGQESQENEEAPSQEEQPSNEGEQQEGEPEGEAPQGEGEAPQDEGGDEAAEGGDQAEDETAEEKKLQDEYKSFEEVRDEVLRRYQVERVISKFIETARASTEQTFAEVANQYGLQVLSFEEPQNRTALDSLFHEKEIDGDGSVISHLFFSPVGSINGRVVSNGTIGAAVKPTERKDNLYKPIDAEGVRDRLVEMWVAAEKEKAAKEKAEAFVALMKSKVEADFKDEIETLRSNMEETIQRRIESEVTALGEDPTDEQKDAAENKKADIRKQEEEIFERGVDDILREAASEKFAEVASELGLEVGETRRFRPSFAGTPEYALMEDGPEKYLTGSIFGGVLRTRLIPPAVMNAEEPLSGEPGLATLDPVRDQKNENFYVVKLAHVYDPAPSEISPKEFQSTKSLSQRIMSQVQQQQKWSFDWLKAPDKFNIQSNVPVDDPNARRTSTSPR
ncbi:MAG: SurA N-terminal domain-containing protein [Planctomycetota bacterium]